MYVFRPIFNIYLKSRFEKKFYILIGSVDDIPNAMRNIINNIENKVKLTKSDNSYLKKNYNKYYKYWFSIIKNNIDIKFIFHKIYIDNSIEDIKKKIFIYISDIANDKFILPQNQQLWIILKNGDRKIIGFYYNDLENKIMPAVSTKPQIDSRFVDKNGFKKKITDLVNNHGILVTDLLDACEFKSYTFHVTDAMADYNYIVSVKKMNDRLLYGYFHKYWPKFKPKYDLKLVKKDYYSLREYYCMFIIFF